jgi:O-antigen/teichoic acid export membrane protein
MVTRNGLMTLAAIGLTTLATYVFQTVMARLLSTVEYGELLSIVAALNIVTIPLFGISMAITRDVAAAKAADRVGSLIQPYVGRMVLITAGLVAGLLLVSPWLAPFLQLSSLTPIVFLALLVTLTNLLGVGRAVLLGMQRFGSVAVNQVTEAILRLVSGSVLAVLGFVSSAGFWGYAVGLLAALALIAYPLSLRSVTGALASVSWTRKIHGFRAHEHDISWPAIVVTGSFIALLNMDLLVVKHFLPPEDAGQYAAMGTLAKGLFVITNAFDVVLFPAASAARASGSDGVGHLQRAILSIAALVIPILAIYFFFGGPLLTLLFGSRYAGAAPLLAPYSLAVTLLGVATLLARYRLAVGRGLPSPTLVMIVLGALLGFLIWHNALNQVVLVLLVTAVVTVVTTVSGAARRV